MWAKLSQKEYGALYCVEDFNSCADDFALTSRLADMINREDYAFDKYKSEKDSGGALDMIFETDNASETAAHYADLSAVTEAQKWAKDLTNEPSNKLYPANYADQIKDKLEPLGIKVTILDDKELLNMGAGAISAVGQGSADEYKPRMVVLEYDGTNGQQARPLGLIGKGVTHDSGGLNIKTSGMEQMHIDMGGSAAMVGTMMAAAQRKANVNVVAIVGLAKNDVDANAYVPGDIITSLSGQTIHIGNTDAEGRLVMADCMTYMQREFDPETIIDAATLTGAVVSVLGPLYAGVFTPDDDLWSGLEKAGEDSQEKGWRLPLHKIFEKAMKGDRSDLTNLSTLGYGGASTAAEFLKNFVEEDSAGEKRKWAHLDIAGAAWPAAGMANGFGVRWLDRFIRNNYETAVPGKLQAQAPAKPSP